MSVLDQFRLDGRRALVTGGSRGLGLEMARGLCEAGAEVIIVGRDEAHLAEAVKRLEAGGGRAVALQADLQNGEEAERMCAAALKKFDKIDVVVNNVGGRRINFPTEDMPLDEWRKIVELNLTQAFVCTKLLGAPMLERRWGRVINVASISGFVAGKPMRGRSYETSKAALAMFTKAVAADWAQHGVTVNAIAPGTFLTDANRRWFKERPELQTEIEATVPMGRLGEPQEIAGLAVYLASEASSYMTGSVVVVDGGRLLW
ncbi:MAG: glucose 1-dehydrogenase [Planctomycetales bacterium]|nr:glucose 1-dehydrogenase [Planctomycetales bacterium]MBN8627333.1 glucose 1-dehydrogenase [Planctomycetota bacterium]